MLITFTTAFGNFEWDSGKNERNRQKHGVSFELACEVFADEFALYRKDAFHNEGEERYQIIGATLSGELLLLVVFTERTRTRIISARLAERREKKLYVERN